MTRGSRRVGLVALSLLIPAFTLAACGPRDGAPAAGAAGEVIPAAGARDGLVVTFATEPNPPVKGDNAVRVTITRADKSPLTEGTVTAVFSMPAMPAMNMPAMRSETALEHEGQGQYRGTGRLSMGGTWNVAITIADAAKEVATRQTSIVAKE